MKLAELATRLHLQGRVESPAGGETNSGSEVPTFSCVDQKLNVKGSESDVRLGKFRDFME